MGTAVPKTRDKPRVDSMLDLQSVPPMEQWDHIAHAVRRLHVERGPEWRLKILLPDTPESAGAVPHLVGHLARAGLRHDAMREPGGVQGMVVTPRSRSGTRPRPLAASWGMPLWR